MENTVFQVVWDESVYSFLAETILAAVALGVLIALINMAGARD